MTAPRDNRPPMKKITGAWPIHAGSVLFTSGTTVYDVTAYITDRFLMIQKHDGETNMYNLDTVQEIRKVREIRPESVYGIE